MNLKNKDLDWLNENLDNLPDFEYLLCERFEDKKDFFVSKELLPTVTDVAEIFKRDIIFVKVDDRAIKGEKVIHRSKDGIPYYDIHYTWQDQIIENPDKQYLVVFDVDDTEPRIVNSLKSFVEKHLSDNMLIAVTCSDENKVRKSTVYNLLKPNWLTEKN